MTNKPTIALALVLTLYVVMAYIYALIKPQWCDEVWQMVPAANLAFNGYLGMGEQTTVFFPTLGSETHMYWYPPLSHVSLAGWFKVFGYGLMEARLHTIAWGVVLLCGVSRVSQVNRRKYPWHYSGIWKYLCEHNAWAGVWAALIVALDYNFLGCSDARPDIMCAALGVWAIATRSAWLAVAAALAHPFGVLYIVVLAVIKRKVEWVPYLVAAALWGLYIMQDPALWWQAMVAQCFVHIVRDSSSPGVGVYLAFGTGWRLVLLATYVGCAAFMALRNRNIAWCLLLLVIPAFLFIRMAYYMPHALPWLALSVAIMMRRYKWLALIIVLELGFAITSLIPIWSWTGRLGL